MDYTVKRLEIVKLRRERFPIENKLMKPKEMLGGPLIERYVPCGKPNCHCKKKGEKGHGPYYYTQIKMGDKYKNIYIGNSAKLIELASRYSEYISNLANLRQKNKEIDKIIEEMNKSKIKDKMK